MHPIETCYWNYLQFSPQSLLTLFQSHSYTCSFFFCSLSRALSLLFSFYAWFEQENVSHWISSNSSSSNPLLLNLMKSNLVSGIINTPKRSQYNESKKFSQTLVYYLFLYMKQKKNSPLDCISEGLICMFLSDYLLDLKCLLVMHLKWNDWKICWIVYFFFLGGWGRLEWGR